MKIILLLLSMISIGFAQVDEEVYVPPPCANKVDKTKNMIFVDVNDSALEIKEAAKAACARGQKLVVVPKNFQLYDKKIAARVSAEKEMNTCYVNNPSNKHVCAEFSQKYETAKKKFDDLREKKENKYTTLIEKELEEIKKAGGTLENFTISGHDGGGSFSGLKAFINRDEIGEVFKKFINPETGVSDINKVKSIMLLGCYTGVPREINNWMGLFPEARIVAGYDGSAPLSDKIEGRAYYYDLLTKEKALTSTADAEALKKVVNNVKYLKSITAAIYIRPICTVNPQDKTFYYNSTGQQTGFREYDIKECEKIQPKLLELQERLEKYYLGLIEPPKDTSKGELRNIYSSARRYQHCSEDSGVGPDPAKAFGLLFSEGIKNSFTHFYRNDLAKAEKILKETTQADFDKAYERALEGVKRQSLVVENLKKEVDFLKEDMPKAIEARLQDYKNKQEEHKRMINDPKYKALLAIYPALKGDGSVNGPGPRPPMTDAQQILYRELSGSLSEMASKKNDYTQIAKDPAGYLGRAENKLQSSQDYLDDMNRTTVKLNVNTVKSFWVPTKENMKGKTRKQIMDNLNNINGFLENRALPDSARKTAEWVNAVKMRHLDSFDVPFSWHEFTGSAESPDAPFKLDEHLESDD